LNSAGGAETYLAKYTPAGTLVWAVTSGGTTDDGAISLDLDASGNIYLTGTFEGTINFGGGPLTASGFDIFVVKYNNAGQHIWSKSFGGTDDEQGNSIKVNAAGTYVAISGSFEGTMNMGTGAITSHGSSNAFVALLDAGGTALWLNGFGGNNFALDRSTTVTMDNALNIYAAGTISGSNIDMDPGAGTHIISSAGSSDIFLSKFNTAGVFQDALIIGAAKGEREGGVVINANGDIYITGYSNSDSIDVDPGAGIHYLYGQTGILFVQDVIVLKYDAAFNYQWGFRIGKRASDSGFDIALDANGNLFITGGMGDSLVDFDPGPGIHYLTGDSNVLNSVPFLAQYNESGNFIDAFSLTGVGGSSALALTGNNKIYITGYFQSSSIDLDPGAGNQTATNAGLFDAFVSEYNYTSTINIYTDNKKELHIFPNPVSDYLYFEPALDNNSEITISDISGKTVMNYSAKNAKSISLKNLKSGMYFLDINNENENWKQRLIKID
ncbi:MAG: T9SS type A sorting domain-containing protein, partial [Bacteroidota bacterium]